MAATPGVLTDWPWKPLGSFKHVVLAPWVVHSVYSLVTKAESERDVMNFMIAPSLLWRMLHNQIWISFARHQTAKGKRRIVDKGIEFDQVDRERNWDDQILLNGLLFYIVNMTLPSASHLPIWRRDGAILMALLHIGPVEFLYYCLHRALHHHYLYSRYHSHHHSSTVSEPITSLIHPFAEHVAYVLLFAAPMMTAVLTRTASVISLLGYITYIDLMNNMGHCNFELVPKRLFSIFPPLKYMMYTPSYHSLHHTQFRTNYCLFMPIYDYIYGTMDKSSDSLYETSLKKQEDSPDVVHLTHLTTPESIYYLQIGFASLASKPQVPKWYLRLMSPVTCCCTFMNSIYGHTFIEERNVFGKLKLQSWTIPRYSIKYFYDFQRQALNRLAKEAIVEADAAGAKVLSLGLLNQGKEVSGNVELYIQSRPELHIKVVDGSSLIVAVVLNSIPTGATQVLLRGDLSKVAHAIISALCQRGIQVSMFYEVEFAKLKLTSKFGSNLALSKNFSEKIWLVGDGFSKEEHLKAQKGTSFIPFSEFPPKQLRKDCFYYHTPSMVVPGSLQNLHSCENWLPRRVMSAARVAGIVHALEGWNVDECGSKMFDVEKVWEASLKHGFRPLMMPHLEKTSA